MLLLGVLAAQAEGAVAAAGSYDLLETEILTGSQASVTFSSLNSTYGANYQHLQIRMVARSSISDVHELPKITFNSTDGNSHYLLGNGSSVSSAYNGSVSLVGYATGATAASDIFTPTVIDILDPFNSTKNTTGRSLSGSVSNVSGELRLFFGSQLYNATTTISTLTISVANNFVAGSRFSLYGLKASA